MSTYSARRPDNNHARPSRVSKKSILLEDSDEHFTTQVKQHRLRHADPTTDGESDMRSHTETSNTLGLLLSPVNHAVSLQRYGSSIDITEGEDDAVDDDTDMRYNNHNGLRASAEEDDNNQYIEGNGYLGSSSLYAASALNIEALDRESHGFFADNDDDDDDNDDDDAMHMSDIEYYSSGAHGSLYGAPFGTSSCDLLRDENPLSSNGTMAVNYNSMYGQFKQDEVEEEESQFFFQDEASIDVDSSTESSSGSNSDFSVELDTSSLSSSSSSSAFSDSTSTDDDFDSRHYFYPSNSRMQSGNATAVQHLDESDGDDEEEEEEEEGEEEEAESNWVSGVWDAIFGKDPEDSHAYDGAVQLVLQSYFTRPDVLPPHPPQRSSTHTPSRRARRRTEETVAAGSRSNNNDIGSPDPEDFLNAYTPQLQSLPIFTPTHRTTPGPHPSWCDKPYLERPRVVNPFREGAPAKTTPSRLVLGFDPETDIRWVDSPDLTALEVAEAAAAAASIDASVPHCV